MSYQQKVHVSLHISQNEFLAFYKGAARIVSVRAKDGRRVQFPAEILRPFVGDDGVHGEFEITFDEDNKLIDIQRLR